MLSVVSLFSLQRLDISMSSTSIAPKAAILRNGGQGPKYKGYRYAVP